MAHLVFHARAPPLRAGAHAASGGHRRALPEASRAYLRRRVDDVDQGVRVHEVVQEAIALAGARAIAMGAAFAHIEKQNGQLWGWRLERVVVAVMFVDLMPQEL